jgi:hypothetical protein
MRDRRSAARESGPPSAPTSHVAIHLATALTASEDLGAMFVYDNDPHAATQAHNLNPLAPR